MQNIPLHCWRCGASLDALPQPLAREAECPACRAQLHVCRFCRLFDPRTSRGCVEERTEPPMDRERANFCDFFAPHEQAFKGRGPADPAAARARLETLFGGAPEPAAPAAGDPARNALEDLFRR